MIQRILQFLRQVGAVFIVCLCSVSSSVTAECLRYTPKLDAPPDLDGPGSFGELQDTVTLDCLKYIGIAKKSGRDYVLIKDDRGKIHELRRGSYMGENTGIIKNFDRHAIYIEQMVNRNGEWVPVMVKFTKH